MNEKTDTIIGFMLLVQSKCGFCCVAAQVTWEMNVPCQAHCAFLKIHSSDLKCVKMFKGKKFMTCQVTKQCMCDNPNFVRKGIYVYTYTCTLTHTNLEK